LERIQKKNDKSTKKRKNTKVLEKEDSTSNPFYMSYEPTQTSRSQDDGMSLEKGIYGNVAMDIAGDEGGLKNQLVNKWDRKRKRFVKVGLTVDVNKRHKNESGVKIKKEDQGKIYEQWKKKHKRELPRVGDKEDKSTSNITMDRFKYKHQGTSNPNKHDKKNAPKDEVKTAEQIAKERRQKQKNKEKQIPLKERLKGMQTSQNYKPRIPKKKKKSQ